MLQKTKVKDIFIITALMFVIVYILFNLIFSGVDTFKTNIKNVIDNVLIIECEFDDGTVTKGSAVILDDDKILSVAHLFPEDKILENIVAKDYKNQNHQLVLEKVNYAQDLAVLTCLTTSGKVEVFDNTKLMYGDEVFKIGNSLGYGISVDKGIISSPLKKINIEDNLRNLIQISMQIYSGDSGAPVFNNQGQLVGIISFKTSTSISTKAELSFIIPIGTYIEVFDLKI